MTFENAQARERTQILFDAANQRHGIVVGTGDMSELALGWCTFNADQTANYNVNAGVPPPGRRLGHRLRGTHDRRQRPVPGPGRLPHVPLPRRLQALGARRASRRWAQYRSTNIVLAAIPVDHGAVPALAWRVTVGEHSLVFAGSFSNRKDVVADFAKDADALIVHHAVQEDVRGEARERFALPSQLGRIAAQANVRMLVLGHRTSRTLGRESLSRAAIEEHYAGPLVFANEMECWGL